jgi:hypothetical protein
MLATALGQASFAVPLVGSPRASRIASQAPAFDAGVLDLLTAIYDNGLDCHISKRWCAFRILSLGKRPNVRYNRYNKQASNVRVTLVPIKRIGKEKQTRIA